MANWRAGTGVVTVAETDQFTGQLMWEPDWAQRVSGWMWLDEFLRTR